MFLSKYFNYILATIIIILTGFGIYYKIGYEKNKQDVLIAEQQRDLAISENETQKKINESLMKQLNSVQEAQKVHQEELNKIKKEKERTDNELKNALKNNRNWSDTFIPDSVWDALQN